MMIKLRDNHQQLTEISKIWLVAFLQFCASSRQVLDLVFEFHRRLLHIDRSSKIAEIRNRFLFSSPRLPYLKITYRRLLRNVKSS